MRLYAKMKSVAKELQLFGIDFVPIGIFYSSIKQGERKGLLPWVTKHIRLIESREYLKFMHFKHGCKKTELGVQSI